MPLTVLAPDRWFGQVKRNLSAGGLLVVVNHGADESRLAVERRWFDENGRSGRPWHSACKAAARHHVHLDAYMKSRRRN
jgi:hypothetical protein